MTTRDEFSAGTRKALASRAGYLCSCPSCRVITIGPSREAPDDVAIVGVAAHICAAAEGGPRYEASMSPEQRSSIENAIWLCAKHATLVDRDVVRFAPDVLRFWKAEHEAYVEAHIGETHIREATPTLNGRPISSEAMQIATERSLLWETRLFGQLLRDEVARSADSIRNLHYGIALEEATVIEPVALFSAIADAMKSAELIGPSITSLVDGPLREASPTGETGDPELIEYVAHAMGEIHRKVVRWGLDWLHTMCRWDEMAELLAALTKLMSEIQAALQRIPDRIDETYEAALAAVTPGSPTYTGSYKVVLNIELTVPEKEMAVVLREIERVGRLIKKGRHRM
jgi:hypothetical protein